MARRRYYGSDHDGSRTTKVLAFALTIAVIFVLGVFSFYLIRANESSAALLLDMKTQVRVCLQTPGCTVERGYAVTMIRCVATETDQFWQITWVDKTQSIVTTPCIDKPSPFTPEDSGGTPTAPAQPATETPAPAPSPQSLEETPSNIAPEEAVFEESSDPAVSEPVQAPPAAQPAAPAPQPAPSPVVPEKPAPAPAPEKPQPETPPRENPVPLLGVGTDKCLVESAVLNLLCRE